MRRKNESVGQLLLKLPWWVSLALGLVLFAGIRWGLPAWAGDDHARQMLAKGISPLAPLPLLLLGIFAIGSLLFSRKRDRLVNEQTNLDQLRKTSWKDFENLVAEAYRRQGYHVEYSLSRGADGGVDITLHQDGQKRLVQCKQWKSASVGASVIRELFGLLTAEKAQEAIIVTTGDFTSEARAFAADKPITLVDGSQLLALIRSVQPDRSNAESKPGSPPPETAAPDCPLCGKPMVERMARRGPNSGTRFWGCSSYPACKGTRDCASLG
jgi:restriction system protein